MTDTAFHLPELPNLTDGDTAEIVLWHVSVGDHVVAGQPLVSISTSNTVVEVPAPGSGRVGVLVAETGQQVHVGDLLLEFTDSRNDHGAVVGNLPDKEPKP